MTFYENTHTHTQIHAFLHLLFQSLFQKFIRFAKHEVLIKIEKHRRFKGALNLYCYAKNSRFILRFENHVCHAFITMQCFRNYRRAALLFHVSHTSLDSRALHFIYHFLFYLLRRLLPLYHKFALQSDI